VSDESTAVLRGQLERALAGDAEARQRLLALGGVPFDEPGAPG
jgi:hypothetical protein